MSIPHADPKPIADLDDAAAERQVECLPVLMRAKVRISDLIIADELKPRLRVDGETVAAYRDAYSAGEALPPVVVFADDTTPGRYWLADGWHRVEAHHAADDEDTLLGSADDRTAIDAEIRPGGKVAAMLYAAGANTTHGRRRDRHDAVAAAKVAIRALTLQGPGRRPTVEAVKATARVGTDAAQCAFRELELEHEQEPNATLLPFPPRDPRGGSRSAAVLFPEEQNDAAPDLDADRVLPEIEAMETTARPFASNGARSEANPPSSRARSPKSRRTERPVTPTRESQDPEAADRAVAAEVGTQLRQIETRAQGLRNEVEELARFYSPPVLGKMLARSDVRESWTAAIAELRECLARMEAMPGATAAVPAEAGL
jgi:hypothetical protein